MAADPFSPLAEAFRILRPNIRFSSMDRPLRTLLVTSPGPIEGKSIAVANLVGVVLNAVPTHKGRYYYYSYHETYGDGRGRRKHRRRRLFGRRRRAD